MSGAATTPRALVLAVVLAAAAAGQDATIPVLAAAAPVQDAGPPPQAAPAPAAQTWTAGAIEARIAELEAATGEDAPPPELVALWEQALEVRRAIDDALARTAEFAAARENAPARLAEIRETDDAPLAQPPPDAPLTALEEALGVAQAAATQAQATLDAIERERTERAARRAELPELIAAATSRRADLARPAVVEGEASGLAQARAVLAALQARRLDVELELYTTELASYEARGQLILARADLAARRLARARQLVDALQTRVSTRRQQEAVAAAEAAARARREALGAHPAIRDLVDENERLAARRLQIASELTAATRAQTETRTLLEEVRAKRARVLEKVEIAGFTDAIAYLLRRHRGELPPPARHAQAAERHRARAVEVQLELMDRQDVLDALRAGPEVAAREVLADVEGADDELLQLARETLAQQIDLARDLIRELDTLFATLIDAEARERELVRTVREYASYIDEHVLWVPSHAAVARQDWTHGIAALDWLLDGRAALETIGSVAAAWRAQPFVTVFWLGGLLLLGVLHPLLHRRDVAIGHELASQRLPPYLPTPRVLVSTAVGAAAWPALVAFLGRELSDHGGTAWGFAVGGGLLATAPFVLIVAFARRVALPWGLAHAHLRWPRDVVRPLRRHLTGLAVVGLPALFVHATLRLNDEDADYESLGRIALSLVLLTLAYFSHRTLRGSGTLAQTIGRRRPDGFTARTMRIWYLLAVGAPLVLVAAAASGYLYTASELGGRLFQTWTIVLLVLVARGVVLRWFFLEERHVRLEQARRRREQAEEQRAQAERAAAEGPGEEDALPPVPPPDPIEVEAPDVDLESLSGQTRGLMSTLAAVAVLVGLLVVWSDVLPALGALDRVPLWDLPETAAEVEDGVDHYVSLADLMVAGAFFVLMVVAARNVPGLIEMAVLRRMSLAAGLGYAVTALVRYTFVVVGVIVTCNMLGLTWEKVQWLVAAMTVGLGFGLQEIFANFVSGLILLFERPVRVGDVVTIGETEGMVARIQMRATTIKDWDLRELVVPNRDFITGRLINWTLTDPVTRIVFPVGVAYGSPTDVVTRTLRKVAEDHPLVLDEPVPNVVFRRFGDSALEFDLRLFIVSRDLWPQVTHEINLGIDAAFREAGITVPFPQRDVHVRTYGAGRTPGPSKETVTTASS